MSRLVRVNKKTYELLLECKQILSREIDIEVDKISHTLMISRALDRWKKI